MDITKLLITIVLLGIYSYCIYQLGFQKGVDKERSKIGNWIDSWVENISIADGKRKRGRPVGSKNKPKV